MLLDAAKDAIYLHRFIEEMGIKDKDPSYILSDNPILNW